MYPIKYIPSKSNKRSFFLDIVLAMGSEQRKFFAIQQTPDNIYCSQYYERGSRTDYHVSRHETGEVHRKLKAQAPFYPVREGQLETPVPMPFEITIQEPQKLPIKSIRGVEQLRLFEMAEGFFSPEALFQRSVARRSKAHYKFHVELDRFVGQLLSFRVFLMEPEQKALLKSYLNQLQEPPREAVTETTVSRVDILTEGNPWLGIVLLIGH